MRRFVVPLVLAASLASASAQATPFSARIDRALARRQVPVLARQAVHNPALALALLRRSRENRSIARQLLLTPGLIVGHQLVFRLARDRAHSAGCWGSVSNSWTWTITGGADVARVTKTQSGWCGNGSSITSDFGWGHSTWSWGPYCLTSISNQHGWDTYPSWKHGGIWGSVGVTYPWGCGGLRGGHAVIRIAANGHWDTYNDYGF